MSARTNHTLNLRVRSEPSAGGFVIESPDVGKGYYSGVGHATQRDPHPRDGGGISAEVAKANATLWAAAPKLLDALKEIRSHRDIGKGSTCDCQHVSDCEAAVDGLIADAIALVEEPDLDDDEDPPARKCNTRDCDDVPEPGKTWCADCWSAMAEDDQDAREDEAP
jgi:hypothetical protein